MRESLPGQIDTLVIGSGFGGAMVAHQLVEAGQRVLLLERGDWLSQGPEIRDEVRGFFQLTPAYTTETAYQVRHRGRTSREGIVACVGGPSVFYGGASFRFREADFRPPPEVVGDSGARWPFDYAEMEPFYARAEELLGVAGETGGDQTEPPRSGPFPHPPVPLAPISRRIAEAARSLGLHPSRIPLAFGENCAACLSCDGYACAHGAKHDLAAGVIPALLGRGLELRPATVALRLVEAGGRIGVVECYDGPSGRRVEYRADRVVLAAGALASPHLLLASGLARLNPGGQVVGRYLMRHCNAFVYAFYPRAPNPEALHHKQVAINDFYFGDPAGGGPAAKLGNLQQVMHPQLGGILRSPARLLERMGAAGRWGERGLAAVVRTAARRLTGLQVIAEDQPRAENRLEIDGTRSDRFGLPRASITHEYTARDLQARAALVARAREILRASGAAFIAHVHEVETFSHAVGTVRAGEDPATSALDADCRFRGVENLYVVDGSFMPTAAALNPSLTIAANALRVGARLARS
jgi:choline dehydrogenase-like flavoprotein